MRYSTFDEWAKAEGSWADQPRSMREWTVWQLTTQSVCDTATVSAARLIARDGMIVGVKR